VQEDESSVLENGLGWDAAGYHRRFRFLLILLFSLLAFVVLAQRLEQPAAPGALMSEESIQGDISLKLSYAGETWAAFIAPGRRQRRQIEAFKETQRRAAISWYEQDVESNPTCAGISRLVLSEFPQNRLGRLQALQKQLSRRSIRGHRAEECKAALATWRDIYSPGRLPAPAIPVYESRIRELRLGWHGRLALADLYQRAQMPEKAQIERANAIAAASRTVDWFIGVLSFLVILGLAGGILAVRYVLRKAARMPEAPNPIAEMPSHDRLSVAVNLLQAFVVYLGIVVGIQIAAALVLTVAGSKTDILDRSGAVLVTTAVYVIAGILSFAYLVFSLRKAGWSWKIVGFTTSDPLKDIAWGIGAYAAALPFVVAAAVVSQYASRYIPTPPNPVIPLFIESRGLPARILLFALVSIAAPFFEELFFRGVLFNSFRARWNAAAGIILSAVVFGMVHPLPLGFLPIFTLGTVFAIVLWERGSLLPGIVAHALNNAVSFAMLLILLG
jgi:membrane protease YdiL (CAAX protease family)